MVMAREGDLGDTVVISMGTYHKSVVLNLAFPPCRLVDHSRSLFGHSGESPRIYLICTSSGMELIRSQ